MLSSFGSPALLSANSSLQYLVGSISLILIISDSVNTTLRYGADRVNSYSDYLLAEWSTVRIFAEAICVTLAITVQIVAGAHPATRSKVRGFCTGRRGEAAGHLTPSSVDVKMSEGIKLVPHMPLWHGKE